MIIYGGIDEAGFGPLLGPLVISLTLFKIEKNEKNTPPPMWEMFKDCITKSKKDSQNRIPINDSKKLKSGGTKKPIKHLERGVLGFYLQNNPFPENDGELFKNFGDNLPDRYPWYAQKNPLPSDNSIDRIMLDSSVIKKSLSNSNTQLLTQKIKMIDAKELNSLSKLAGTKSRVNLDAILTLVENTRNLFYQTCPRIIIDRQGGRTHYLKELQRFWNQSKIQIVGETENIARYRISDNKGVFILSFETKSEENHFPVALSSMVAKYCRELSMKRINTFFGQQIPFLSPTAGYVQDGRRFVQEIKPILDKILDSNDHFIRTI